MKIIDILNEALPANWKQMTPVERSQWVLQQRLLRQQQNNPPPNQPPPNQPPNQPPPNQPPNQPPPNQPPPPINPVLINPPNQPPTQPPPNQLSPTGSPTLDQPLAPSVRGPGFLRGVARGIGTVAKVAGAAASIPQGIARATKKGYQAGVQAIGGPGSQTSFSGTQRGTTLGTGTSAGRDELAQMQQTLAAMDQRLRSRGI